MLIAKWLILRKIEGVSSAYQSELRAQSIGFGDVMDIVLYYLSLQSDIDEIGAGVNFRDFFNTEIRDLWADKWINIFDFVSGYPWSSGPGPLGGTMGAAEYYAANLRGTIKEYFLWPENLARESEYNWPKHRWSIEEQTFFKFWQPEDRKRLEAILDFAEAVCQLLRQEAAERKKP